MQILMILSLYIRKHGRDTSEDCDRKLISNLANVDIDFIHKYEYNM